MQSNDKPNATTVCIVCLQAYIIASISLPKISGDPNFICILFLYSIAKMLTLIPMCCVTSINLAGSYNYAVKFILFCT